MPKEAREPVALAIVGTSLVLAILFGGDNSMAIFGGGMLIYAVLESGWKGDR